MAEREPPAGSKDPPAPAPLPRGHHGLSREFVAHHQRERLMAALAREVARRGYPSTTVDDILKAARVSRRAFYEQFHSKRDCFDATLEIAITELCRRVAAATAAEPDWALRVGAAIVEGLRFLADEPELARLIVIEAPNAGPQSGQRYRTLVDDVVAALRAGPERSADSEAADAVVVGGAASILAGAINRGEGESVDGLAPDLIGFVLTPYVGAARAESIARQAG